MRVPAASHGTAMGPSKYDGYLETVLFLFSYFSAVGGHSAKVVFALSLCESHNQTATLVVVPSLITAWTPRTCDGLMMA